MEKKYSITFKGIKVDVVEAKQDSVHQVQIAVLGEQAFSRKLFKDYKDEELESKGWTKLSLVNGSLFFTEGSDTFANGIEKAYGVIHENDDASYDNNLGFYHNDSVPYIYTQRYIKTILNQPYVRGAITSAFGLLNNGVLDISGAKVGQPSRSIYLAKSGRTIIGKKSDGTIIFAVCDGVTGSSGLTGYEAYQLALQLGLRNAVCMDGGGSTYLEYKGYAYNGSDRLGANAVAIYIKELSEFKPNDVVRINGSFTIGSISNGKAFINELNALIDFKYLSK